MVNVIITNGDLFEIIQEKTHCEYISDLRDMNRNVKNNLDCVLLNLNPLDYTFKQWQDLSLYLFPHLKADLPSDPEQLRNNLILAVQEYRKIKDRCSLLKTTH